MRLSYPCSGVLRHIAISSLVLGFAISATTFAQPTKLPQKTIAPQQPQQSPPPQTTPPLSKQPTSKLEEWDDWVFYSPQKIDGFSLGLLIGAGGLTLDGYPIGPFKQDTYWLTAGARVFYTIPAVQWVQASWSLQPGFSTVSLGTERGYVFGLTSGPGLQIRFLRFPFLSPFFVAAEIPGSFIKSTGTAGQSRLGLGWSLSGGMELAYQLRHSLGFRVGYEKHLTSDSTRSSEIYAVALEYRFYLKGNIFTGN